VNSRERVLAAIHHEIPDRVPVDLGGMRSTGIMALCHARLRQSLDLSGGDIHVFDVMQQLALVEEPILQRFGCDVVILDRGALGPWQDGVLPDGTPVQLPADFKSEPDGEGGHYWIRDGIRASHMPASSHYFDSIYHPLAEAESIDDLDRYEWPVMEDEVLERLHREARRLYETTDYAILGSFGGAFLEAGQGLRGWGQFLVDLAADRAFAEAILDRVLHNLLRNVERYLDAVGDYIQIIQVGGDLGTQNGPQIQPQWYYEAIQPRQKEYWSRIHALSDCAIFLHSCGGIYDLIPGIVDAGCDILNPVQTTARGMDPVRLKREFGDHLTFWGGGCDTQHVLPFASPEEVREHVSRQVEIFKPGGGFVFSQIHNIQAGTPPENIEAMYQAVHDHWTYGRVPS
jgi:uroporphyrinogen decarboxylase